MPTIRVADFADPRVIDLLSAHVTRARNETAVGSAHALDLAGLQTAAITVWTAWNDDQLLGVAALKRLAAAQGEVKSMYTAESARRSGVGSALLNHVIAQARAEGLKRLSLETGSSPYFAPARAFYARYGFAPCNPFADYRLDPNSVFMTLDLTSS